MHEISSLLRFANIAGVERGWCVERGRSQNRIQYVHLLARRGREPAAAQTDQCSAFQYKQYYWNKAGGRCSRCWTKFAGTRGCAEGGRGTTGLPWRMRVDVSAGLRRMNEGRRVMLPRYCTARHERISKGGGGEGGWLPVPPPGASFPPRARQRFDPFEPDGSAAVDAVLCVSWIPWMRE